MIFSDTWTNALLLIHLASCLFMTGVIWYVQIVVYPQLRNVPEDFFAGYYSTHTLRTGFIVGPPMLVELVSGSALLLIYSTRSASGISPFLIAFLPLLLIWLSTLFLQIPLHAKLEKQRDACVIEKLIKGNWIRTILWSFRSLWLMYLLFPILKPF